MASISFNKDYLDFVNSLAVINPCIKFKKIEDKIVILNTPEKSRTLVYKLEAPAEFFGFNGMDLSFFNYPEFFKYIDAFDSVDLSIDVPNVTIKSKNSMLKYQVTSPNAVPKIPSDIELPQPDIICAISAEELQGIAKKASLVNAITADVSFDGTQVVIKLYNDGGLNQNSYSHGFDIEPLINPVEPFSFQVHPDLLLKVPRGVNYKFNIIAAGAVALSFTDYNRMNFIVIASKIKKLVNVNGK